MMKQGFVALKSGDWEEYKNTFRKEMKERLFHRIKEAFEKVAKDVEKTEHRPRNHDKQHGLRAAHHRASRRAKRRHDVIVVPALQQFSCGRLRLVGLSGEEAQQLVVRELWRKMGLEATKPAFGGTNR